MKINKTMVIICVSGMLVSGLSMYLPQMQFLCAIWSNIFTGFFVSFVISLIGYFHERNKLNVQTVNSLTCIYKNIDILDKLTFGIISGMDKIEDIEKVPFFEMQDLSKSSIECIEKIDMFLYDGFLNTSKIAIAYRNIKNLVNSLWNIKHMINDIQLFILKQKIKDNEMQFCGYPPGSVTTSTEAKSIVRNKALLIHEDITKIKNELEKLMDLFFKQVAPKIKWKDFKVTILKQNEFIEKIILSGKLTL